MIITIGSSCISLLINLYEYLDILVDIFKAVKLVGAFESIGKRIRSKVIFIDNKIFAFLYIRIVRMTFEIGAH